MSQKQFIYYIGPNVLSISFKPAMLLGPEAAQYGLFDAEPPMATLLEFPANKLPLN